MLPVQPAVHWEFDGCLCHGLDLLFKMKTRALEATCQRTIVGSKEFVFSNYQRFKHLFYSKHEKKPKPIKGLDGIYLLKRLSEIILKTDRQMFASGSERIMK